MSNRSWGYYTALGAIALALLALSYVAYSEFRGCNRPYDPPRYATADEHPALQSGSLGQTKVYPQTKIKVVRCEEPQSEKEFELCQQRNTARASEDAVCVARAQYYLAIIVLAFVVGTFMANAVAALGAKRTAEVAAETVQAAIAADLPRLRVSKMVFSRANNAHPRDNSKYAQVTIGFANYGGKAARVTRYCLELEFAVKLPAEPDYKSCRNVFSNQIVVPASGEFIFPPLPYMDGGGLQLAEVLANKKRFWVYRYIAYLDHLDREHMTGFVAWWNHIGSGSDTFPDEATQRGETFNPCRIERYLRYIALPAGKAQLPPSQRPVDLGCR